MTIVPKLVAAAALSVVLLAGCAYVPPAPAEVPPVNGSPEHPPAPVSPPANVGASVSGSWTGYWTWDGPQQRWVWTWVWNSSGGSYTVS